MAYFDWDPVVPDSSEALSRLGQTIGRWHERRDRRLDRERQILKDKEYARQNDLNEQRAATQFDRQEREWELRNADRNAATTAEILKANREGAPGEAEAIAKTRSYVDPKTGKLIGVGYGREAEFKKVQLDEPDTQQSAPGIRTGISALAPPPGMAPEVPEWQKGFAKLLGPGALRRPGEEPSDQEEPVNPGAFIAAAQGIPQVNRLEENLGDYQQQVRTGGGRPFITTPSGEKLYLDPNERASFQKQKQGEAADNWLNSTVATVAGDPKKEEAARITSDAIRGGLSVGQAGAYFLGTLQRLGSEQFRGAEGDKDRANRVQVAGVRGRGGGQKKPGPDLTVQGADGGVYDGRTLKEAEELREQKKALDGGLKVADDLIADLRENGRLVPLWDSDKQGARNVFISRMLEAKKHVTGAVNEADALRAAKMFDTSITKGPDGAINAVEAWKRQLAFDYDAAVKAKAVARGGARAPAGAAAPVRDKALADKIIEDIKNGR